MWHDERGELDDAHKVLVATLQVPASRWPLPSRGAEGDGAYSAKDAMAVRRVVQQQLNQLWSTLNLTTHDAQLGGRGESGERAMLEVLEHVRTAPMMFVQGHAAATDPWGVATTTCLRVAAAGGGGEQDPWVALMVALLGALGVVAGSHTLVLLATPPRFVVAHPPPLFTRPPTRSGCVLATRSRVGLTNKQRSGVGGHSCAQGGCGGSRPGCVATVKVAGGGGGRRRSRCAACASQVGASGPTCETASQCGCFRRSSAAQHSHQQGVFW